MNKKTEYKMYFTNRYKYFYEEMPFPNSSITKGILKFKQFDDGERYYKFETEEIKDQNIILVGGTSSDQDVLELFDMGTSLVQHGAKSLIILCPYFGYSTMERAVSDGEIVMAKNRAIILSSIPKATNGNSVYLYDLHSEGIPYYFEGNVVANHIYGKSFIQKILDKKIRINDSNRDDFMLASTDSGRAKWVESLGRDFHLNTAFAYKQRIGNEVRLSGINANVKDKNVIVYDDMIRSGKSLLNAIRAYKDAGAKDIYVITTHGLFAGKEKLQDGSERFLSVNEVEDNLFNSGLIKELYCTNSHPNSNQVKKVQVIDVYSDLIKAILK